MNYFNYFSEIEELFIRRRGRNLLLSPLDWALIESWQEREVPLHIILSGIERVFDSVDKQPARKRSVKSLLYCKEEIEAQYAEWLERQVGKNGAATKQDSRLKIQDSENNAFDSPKSELFSGQAMTSHLEKVLLEIKSAQSRAGGDFQQTLSEVSNQLTKLKNESHAAEKLEESLEKLDALVDESLLQTFETENLKAEIERQIASYKTKMEREVYERTFDLMLLKRLRERAGIPRLSLFYL